MCNSNSVSLDQKLDKLYSLRSSLVNEHGLAPYDSSVRAISKEIEELEGGIFTIVFDCPECQDMGCKECIPTMDNPECVEPRLESCLCEGNHAVFDYNNSQHCVNCGGDVIPF